MARKTSLAVAALAVFPLCAGESLIKEADRQRAPDFELEDATGSVARIADYDNKVVVINFWATWCVPCKEEIPWLKGFVRNYREQGLEVLGISLDEKNWDAVKTYIQKTGINYRIAMGDARTAYKYGKVEALPVTFVVDRQRRVAAIHFGLMNKKKVEAELKMLLAPAP
jgi:peroxiredoxin